MREGGKICVLSLLYVNWVKHTDLYLIGEVKNSNQCCPFWHMVFNISLPKILKAGSTERVPFNVQSQCFRYLFFGKLRSSFLQLAIIIQLFFELV